MVKDRLALKKSEIFDGCPIALDWKEFAHFDALAQDLPDALVYLNVPFSKTAHWLIFGL